MLKRSEPKEPPWMGYTTDRLVYMQEHGSSVLLNWGEDTNLWECSWITGGERYTGVSRYLGGAVHQAMWLGCGRPTGREGKG